MDALVRLSSVLLVATLFAANCFRAATQPLTLDEAITWQLYVAGPPIQLLHYDANHHLLHTYLCRLSATLFSDSEFALRLPSVLFGLLYLLLARHLTVGLRADTWGLLGCVLLTCNPFVLDYLSLARGYGMALALFAAAFASWLRMLSATSDDPPRWRLLFGIGALHALTVLANLAFAVPVVVLVLTSATLLACRLGSPLATCWRAAWRLTLPATVLVVLLGVPLLNARAHHFYFGVMTLFESVRSVIAASLDHASVVNKRAPAILDVCTYATLGAGAIAVVPTVRWALRCAWRYGPTRPYSAHALAAVLAYAVVLGAFGLWGILHFALGTPWPRERTALVYAPCFALALTMASALAPVTRVGKILRAGGAALLFCVAGVFLSQLLTRDAACGAYRTWRPDAAALRVHAELRTATGGRSAPTPVFCAHGTWPSLYYCEVRRPTVPPLLLHESPMADVPWELLVFNPAFAAVKRDGGAVTCDLRDLGRVRGRLVYEDAAVGVMVLRRTD